MARSVRRPKRSGTFKKTKPHNKTNAPKKPRLAILPVSKWNEKKSAAENYKSFGIQTSLSVPTNEWAQIGSFQSLMIQRLDQESNVEETIANAAPTIFDGTQ